VVVKRYVLERGTDVVKALYSSAWNGEVKLSFSLWNIGEILDVLNRYRQRGWLGDSEYRTARVMFLSETVRMLRLGLLKIVPLRLSIVSESWKIVEKHNIYEADAIQIASAKHIKASELYTADKKLCDVASKEGVKVVCIV
jgi:predicted nucleic acid-binding protein